MALVDHHTISWRSTIQVGAAVGLGLARNWFLAGQLGEGSSRLSNQKLWGQQTSWGSFWLGLAEQLGLVSQLCGGSTARPCQ